MPRSKLVNVTIPGFGTVPMTRFSISILSLVVVAIVAVTAYMKLYRQPEQLILNVEQANKQLREAMEEYGRHMMEEPAQHELFKDTDGKLMLRVFSDHCVLIQLTTRNGVRSKLIMDLSREGGQASASIIPLAFAEELDIQYPPLGVPQGACARGCLNPHPGTFVSWYGGRDGCWIEVWRQWPDGCTHVQMFNTCSPGGYWDSNPDGTAKVRWTCCTH